jgi:serine/threonine protein phosphatase PrpC
MEIDPYLLKSKIDESTLIYASISDGKTGSDIHSSSSHFNDECFVIADSLKTKPNSALACRLACDTAIWGYKLIRQRRFYWADKKLLVRRIFRTVNISLWQKHRESGFESGIAASLIVAIIGPENIWMGTVGDSKALIYRNNQILYESKMDLDNQGKICKSIGPNRFGLTPQLYIQQFIKSDTLVIASNDLFKYLNINELSTVIFETNHNQESLDHAIKSIIDIGKSRGLGDDINLSIIKRIG